jgi:hypothetical protein
MLSVDKVEKNNFLVYSFRKLHDANKTPITKNLYLTKNCFIPFDIRIKMHKNYFVSTYLE